MLWKERKSVKRGRGTHGAKNQKLLRRVVIHRRWMKCYVVSKVITMDDGWWLGNNSHYKSQTWTGHWMRGSFHSHFKNWKIETQRSKQRPNACDVRCRSFFLVLPCHGHILSLCHLHIHNNDTTRLLMAMSATIHAHTHILSPGFIRSHAFQCGTFFHSFVRTLLPSIVFHKLKSKNHLLLLHYIFLQLAREWVCFP